MGGKFNNLSVVASLKTPDRRDIASQSSISRFDAGIMEEYCFQYVLMTVYGNF